MFRTCRYCWKNKNRYEYNQVLFEVPDNYLSIDTDSEPGYTELKKLLKDNNLYRESTKYFPLNYI